MALYQASHTLEQPQAPDYGPSEPLGAPTQSTQTLVDSLPPKIDLRKAFAGLHELDFVFPGLLQGGTGMIAAPGGTGKSYLLLAMAASVAMGVPFLPTWPVNKPQRVIVLLAEDPPELVHNRLHYLGKLYDAEKRALLEKNLEVRSLVGCIPTLLADDFGVTSRTALANAISDEAKGARLLVLDPIRRFHTGDENDSSLATVLIQTLERIALEAKCAIIFSHHTSKGASLSGQGDAQQAARGSSAFTDGVRWQANMIGMSEDDTNKCGLPQENRKKYVRMALSKANYTEGTSDVWFERMEGGVLQPCTFPEWGTDFNPVSRKRSDNNGGRKRG